MGGQMGQTQQSQMGGQRLQDVQTQEERQAIDAISRAIEACEFCAEQCIAKGDAKMANCIRLCEDVSEIGEASQVLLTRRSDHSVPTLQLFEQAMAACAQECSRHSDAHCQDCASVLGQSMNAIQRLTGATQQMGQQGMAQQSQQGGAPGTQTQQRY